MRFIDAATLEESLDFPGLMDALRTEHQGPMPAAGKTLLEHDTGDETPDSFLILPAWLPGRAFGVKTVTVMPANPNQDHGFPAVQAVYQLFAGDTGKPTATIDGTVMTYWKTAADSGLASQYLSRVDAETLLMVGAGALAPYLVRAHLAARPSIAEVIVWNRTPGKAERLAEAIAAMGTEARATTELEDATGRADVISCATASTTPIIDGDLLRPGAHLDLVGGFTPEMRESNDAAATRASVFFDSEKYALSPGDISQPLEAGLLTRERIHDLFDLCRGDHPGRQSTEEITMFKNAGGAHHDLFTGMHILSIVGTD